MRAKYLFVLFLLVTGIYSCDWLQSDPGDPAVVDLEPMGILDMAFVYRIQGVPKHRVKKVELSLARTADDLYEKKFFTTTNVSEAVTHYQFRLPPGDYFYSAVVVCLCGGDSCKYAGFSGQFGHLEAGGKVSVIDGEVTHFTTQFH